MSEIERLKSEAESYKNKKHLKPYEERLLRSLTNLQIPVFERINKFNYFEIALNGTEHTHPNFVENIRNSQDQTSLFIRYQPDGVISVSDGKISPLCAQLEVKAGFTIEKNAYEQYFKLHSNGNVIIIVFKDFLWNFLEDIKLIDGNQTISKFPEDKRFPVDEEGWICPRQSDRWLNHVRYSNRQASGTPYKEVDRNSLNSWDLFERLVILRLCQKLEVKMSTNQYSSSSHNYRSLNKKTYQNTTQEFLFEF